MIKVNEEKERYVVYHEWREESHTFAVSEELGLRPRPHFANAKVAF